MRSSRTRRWPALTIRWRSCGPLPCTGWVADACRRRKRCDAWPDESIWDAGWLTVRVVQAPRRRLVVPALELVSASHRSITSQSLVAGRGRLETKSQGNDASVSGRSCQQNQVSDLRKVLLGSVFLRPDTLDLTPDRIRLRRAVRGLAARSKPPDHYAARKCRTRPNSWLQPTVVIRQAMRTNNAKFGKLTMEMLNLARSRNF